MQIVADTSALLALAACDGLRLLESLFDEVRVPGAVFRECTVPGKPEADHLRGYLAERVEEIDLSGFVISATGLGHGELEAMALYKRRRADRLLMDDRRARKVAVLNDVAVIGSISVLLAAKNKGYLPGIASLEAIRRAGIFLGDELMAEALRIAGE